MPKYEIAIAVKDEIEAHRKKEGDIVTVRPYPWKWGRKEIDEYLIVIVECDFTFPEIKAKLKSPLYEGGHQRGVTFRYLEPPEEESSSYDRGEHVVSLPSQQIIPRPAIIGKNKYRILLADLGSVDKAKIRDKKYIYQPFKSAKQLVEAFDGIGTNHLLTETDVDCAALAIGSEEEKSTVWDAANPLVQDKSTNSYIKPPKK